VCFEKSCCERQPILSTVGSEEKRLSIFLERRFEFSMRLERMTSIIVLRAESFALPVIRRNREPCKCKRRYQRNAHFQSSLQSIMGEAQRETYSQNKRSGAA